MRASPSPPVRAAVTLLAVAAAVLLWAPRAAALDTVWQADANASGHHLKNLPAPGGLTEPLRLHDMAVGSCAIWGTGVDVATFRCGVDGTDYLSPQTGLKDPGANGYVVRTSLGVTSASATIPTSVFTGTLLAPQAPAITGAVTASAGSFATAFGSAAGLSLLGVTGASPGVPAFFSATTNNQVAQMLGGTLQFHSLDFSQLTGTPPAITSLTGAVVGSGPGATATTFGAGATTSLLGVTGSSAARADIPCSGDGQVFWDNAGAVGCAALPYAKVTGTPTALPPSGAAGGDLGLNYPAPTVLAAEFGAQRLTFATTADGALLKRSGTSVGPAVQGTDYVVTVRADGIATGTIQLASLSAANMLDGAVAYVDTVDDLFKLQASTATADNITIVNASGKTGFRWMRMGIVSLRWQAVTTWNVDPSGGNDENDGTASALKTLAEWARRTHGIVVGASGVTVNLVGDVPDSDSLVVNFSGTGPSSFVLLNGGASVISTQTVSSAQARNAASNLANEITTPGDLSAFVNDMVCLHGTTSCAFIVKAVGTGVARLSELVTTAGAQVASGGVTAGQTIDVLQTRKGPLSVSVNGNIELFVANVRFDGSGTVSFSQSSGGSAIILEGAIIGGTSFSVSSTAGFDPWQTLFKAPGFTSGGVFEGDAFTADVSFQTVAQQAGYAKLRSTFWQGAQCTVAGGVLHLDGDFATFDLPTGKSGVVLNGGTGVGEGAIAHWNSGRHYGSGNSGSANVWFVGIGSWVSYPAATPPTMNAGNGISINGGNVAVGSVPISLNPITGSAVYALGGTATAGVLTQDAAGNLFPRSITSTGGSIVITNATGGGNINLEAAAAGLADPGSNGILVRTALNTTTARTLTNGDGTINFSFPDGVAGNPEIHVNAIPESKVTNLVTDLAGKQATGNYLTGLSSAVTATGPGAVTATVHLDAGSTVQGLLPLGNLVNCAAGQIVGMIGGVEGCVTPTAGTIYTGTSPVVVSGSIISCPTCTAASLTAGSVVFSGGGGILSQDNAGFFYDGTNHRLGLGTTIPSYPLDILLTGNSATNVRVSNLSAGTSAAAEYLASNNAGALSYSGITSTTYAAYAPINGGKAYFGGTAPLAVLTQNADPIVFYTNGSEVGRWLSGGGLQISSSDGSGNAINLTQAGAQTVNKSGGILFLGTSSNNDVGFYSNNITEMTLKASGALQLASLAAGGITKAAVTSGQLGIASSADVAAAITWPAATDVLVSTGPSTAPAGDSNITINTGSHTFTSASATVLGGSVQLTGAAGSGEVLLGVGNTGFVELGFPGAGLSFSGGVLSLVPDGNPFHYEVTYGGPNFISDLPPNAFTGANPDFWLRPNSGFNAAVGGPANFAAQGQTWEVDTGGSYATVSLRAFVYQCGISTSAGVNDFTFTVTKNGVSTGVAIVASCPSSIAVNTDYSASGSVSFGPTDRVGIRGTVTNTGSYSSGVLRATAHLRLSP